MKPYPKESWIDPRIETRASEKGTGMFATAPIMEGEVVTIWGGTVFTNNEKESGKVKKQSASRIDAGHWLGAHPDEPYGPDLYLNHSCDPNIWLIDENTLVARRDIAPGEEVLADYSTWSIDDAWVMDEECRCGSPLCRHRITGQDWKLPGLRARYRGHFVPYINDEIARTDTEPVVVVEVTAELLQKADEYLALVRRILPSAEVSLIGSLAIPICVMNEMDILVEIPDDADILDVQRTIRDGSDNVFTLGPIAERQGYMRSRKKYGVICELHIMHARDPRNQKYKEIVRRFKAAPEIAEAYAALKRSLDGKPRAEYRVAKEQFLKTHQLGVQYL